MVDAFTVDKELDQLNKRWAKWGSEQTEFKRVDGHTIQVLTPFTDAFDDGILFEIVSDDHGTYSVTDKGYTIWNLETNGINVSRQESNRYQLLNSIVRAHQCSITDTKEIKRDDLKLADLPQAITDFIQVLINVSGIAFLNSGDPQSDPR